jgi:hypothetical protein
VKTALARVASDHLPLVVDLDFSAHAASRAQTEPHASAGDNGLLTEG